MPTRDEVMQQLADAQAGVEAATMGLIVLELDELLTGLAASEDQAAAALRAAAAALSEPDARLAAMDAEIIAAEGTCVEWSGKLSDPDPDKRAVARSHFTEWSAEVDALRARRDAAERDYRPLVEEQGQRRTALAVLQSAKRAVYGAMLAPFGSELAQATAAYAAFRMPQLVPVLLRRDLDSPEWDKAAAEFDQVAMRSGLRTDHLPSEAEQIARALAAPMADALSTPPVVPNAVEVLKQDEIVVGNMALQQQPSRIDDYRRPGPPREVPDRPHMEVPKLRDMGIR